MRILPVILGICLFSSMLFSDIPDSTIRDIQAGYQGRTSDHPFVFTDVNPDRFNRDLELVRGPLYWQIGEYSKIALIQGKNHYRYDSSIGSRTALYSASNFMIFNLFPSGRSLLKYMGDTYTLIFESGPLNCGYTVYGDTGSDSDHHTSFYVDLETFGGQKNPSMLGEGYTYWIHSRFYYRRDGNDEYDAIQGEFNNKIRFILDDTPPRVPELIYSRDKIHFFGNKTENDPFPQGFSRFESGLHRLYFNQEEWEGFTLEWKPDIYSYDDIGFDSYSLNYQEEGVFLPYAENSTELAAPEYLFPAEDGPPREGIYQITSTDLFGNQSSCEFEVILDEIPPENPAVRLPYSFPEEDSDNFQVSSLNLNINDLHSKLANPLVKLRIFESDGNLFSEESLILPESIQDIENGFSYCQLPEEYSLVDEKGIVTSLEYGAYQVEVELMDIFGNSRVSEKIPFGYTPPPLQDRENSTYKLEEDSIQFDLGWKIGPESHRVIEEVTLWAGNAESPLLSIEGEDLVNDSEAPLFRSFTTPFIPISDALGSYSIHEEIPLRMETRYKGGHLDLSEILLEGKNRHPEISTDWDTTITREGEKKKFYTFSPEMINQSEALGEESIEEWIGRFSSEYTYRAFSSAELNSIEANFTDLDGDQVWLCFYLESSTGVWIPYLKETYLHLGESRIGEIYPLPLRFFLDREKPDIFNLSLYHSDLSFSILETESALAGRSIPQEIRISDISDLSGIQQIDLFYGELTYSISEPVIIENNVSLTWPFESLVNSGETKGFPFRLRLTDFAGNYRDLNSTLIIDRTDPPLPNGEGEWIRIDSPDISAHYPEKNTIHLQLREDFFVNPLDMSSLTFDLGDWEEAPEITSVERLDPFTLKIKLSPDCPPDQEIPLLIILSDLTGNSSSLSTSVFSPAELKNSDLEILQEKETEDYPFSIWDGKHQLGFTRSAAFSKGWSSLRMIREGEAGDVLVSENALFSEDSFFDSPLEPHQSYSYRIYPVNKSGYFEENSGLAIPLLILGNYSPAQSLISEVKKGDKSFFGPLGDFHLLLNDPDGDDLSTRILVDNTLWNQSATQTPLIFKGATGEYLLPVAEGESQFTDGETYVFRLSTTDHFTEEGKISSGNPVESEEFFFSYDDTPPVLEKEPEWINPGLSQWGQEGFKVSASDEGCGVEKIWAELLHRETGELLHTLTPLKENQAEEDLEGQIQEFSFPEGQFLLQLKSQDPLENEGNLLETVILNDRTPPVIIKLGLENIEDSSYHSERYWFSFPVVQVSLEIEDLSGFSEIQYQYRQEDRIICSGSKKIHQTSEKKPSLICTPDLERISQGEAYSLYLKVIDRGGNSSDWSSLTERIAFDFQPPVLTLEPLNRPTYNGFLVTGESTLTLPDAEAVDQCSGSIMPSFRLLDQQEVLIKKLQETLDFPGEGFYFLEVSATDNCGLTSIKQIPLLYDRSIPEGAEIHWISEMPSELTTGDTLRFYLEGEDRLSRVEGYRIQLIRGEKVFVDREISRGEAHDVALLLPEDMTEGSYEIRLGAEDLAGNRKTPVEKGQLLLKESDSDLFINMPSCLGKDKDLSLFWSYQGEEEISCFQVNLLGLNNSGSSPLLQKIVDQSSITIPSNDLDLLGLDYITAVITPVNREGFRLQSRGSSRVRIDLESPEIVLFETPSMIGRDGLIVSWEVRDDSSLQPPRFLIESIADSDGQIEWTPLLWISDKSLENTGSLDLSLALNQDPLKEIENLRIRLLARDWSGNICEAVSPLIPVIREQTSDFAVIDQGDYINPSLNRLEFSWTWAKSGPRTGEEGYWYQLCQERSAEPEKWEFTTERTVTYNHLQYKNGTTLYLMVKRQTLAGMEEIQFSDGITLDDSAPLITDVLFQNQAPRLKEEPFFSDKKTVALEVRGYDQESGIDRFLYQPGVRGSGSFYSLGKAENSSLDYFTADIPNEVQPGAVLYFEVTAFNGTGQFSLPSYSKGMIYQPEGPEAKDLLISISSETLSACWWAFSQTPLKTQKLEIFNGENLVKEEILPGNIRQIVLNDLNLPDGNYQARLTLTDITGQSLEIRSPSAVLDTQPPQWEKINYSKYLYNHLKLELEAREPITDLELILNSGSQTLMERNLSLGTGLSHWSKTLDLTQLLLWEEMKWWETRLLNLSLRARDQQGNWSDPVSLILHFDGTPPLVPVIHRDKGLLWQGQRIEPEIPLTGINDRIRDLEISCVDDQSPLTGYRWALAPSPEGIPENWSPLQPIKSPAREIHLKNLEWKGLQLESEELFYLALQVKNEADLFSDTGYYGPLEADLSPPEFSMEFINSLYVDQEGSKPLYILYGKGFIEVTLEHEQCPAVIQSFQVLDSNGKEIQGTLEGVDLRLGNSWELPVEVDPDQGGVFQVKISLEDLLGREKTHSMLFKNYRTPEIQIPQDLTARPGEPIKLDYQSWISDASGISTLEIFGESLETPILRDWDESLELTLTHGDPLSQETLFPLFLKITDFRGIETTEEFSISLKNTEQGELRVNEYWSGTHHLTGPVIVPEGITLTLAGDTQVLARSGSLFGENISLIFEDGSEWVNLGNTTYSTSGEEPETVWQGIRYKGSHQQEPLVLEGLTINHAVRGLVLFNSSKAHLRDCTFSQNQIGLHVLSSQVQVENSLFIENLFYGVKEEMNSDPVMIGNHFQNNGFDYYDSKRTVIDGGETNNIDSVNPENRGVEK